jgi:hypothetical protein
MFSLIPYVPRGVTLPSFARVIQYVNSQASYLKTIRILFGGDVTKNGALFGVCSSTCAQVIAKGTFSDANSVLYNHTIWPFFAYTLPEPIRNTWNNSIISRQAVPPYRFLSQPKNFPIIKSRCHGCMSCVESDLDEYGLAFWRVDHQLAGIDHCPRHQAPLFCDCARCGTFGPAQSISTPPTGKCTTCGAKLVTQREVSAHSEYWRLLELVRFVFEGHWHILDPCSREIFFASKLTSHGQWPPRIEFASELLNQLVRNWGESNLNSLSLRISDELSPDTVLDTLLGNDLSTDPLLHLLLMQHFADSRNLLADFNGPQYRQASQVERPHASSWATTSSRPYALPECKHRELLLALFSAHLPLGFANRLAAGNQSWRSLLTGAGYTKRAHLVAYQLPWFHTYTLTIDAVDNEANGLSRPGLTQAACKKQFDNQRKRHRATCLAYIDTAPRPTRTQFDRTTPAASRWLHANDPRWLNKHLPSAVTPNCVVRPVTAKVSRERILRLLERHPGAMRAELNILGHAYLSWARAYDFEWLEAVVPQARGRRA